MYCVYIVANKKNGTLYIGVTNDLERRITEHKEQKRDGFSKKYGTNKLVWYDLTCDVNAAIKKEKQMKAWKREWKLNLIEETNPEWNDLFYDLTQESILSSWIPK